MLLGEVHRQEPGFGKRLPELLSAFAGARPFVEPLVSEPGGNLAGGLAEHDVLVGLGELHLTVRTLSHAGIVTHAVLTGDVLRGSINTFATSGVFMEFGIFLNGYLPGPAAHQTELEHTMLFREAEYVIFADKHNWKYAWLGEHHSLTEYSHMSAPEVVIGYIAAQTDYIHLSTGINSLSPAQGAPGALRRACRHAGPLHQQPVRVGHRSRRRQPRARQLQHHGQELDQGRVGRGRRARSRGCGSRSTTRSRARHFTVPTPHNMLPKPYGKGHPPIWVACGNPPTFDRAGELGIGAIAFNFEPIFNLRGRIEAYKEGVAKCTEPIGQFKNDNVMITNSVICCETREEARAIALRRGPRLPRARW